MVEKVCVWKHLLFGGILLFAANVAFAQQCLLNNSDAWRDDFIEVPGDFTGDGLDDLLLVGNPNSLLCTGPDFDCSLHNTSSWSQFDVIAGNFNGDAYEDLFLVGAPDSQICLGPSLSCTTSNSKNWATQFTATSGDFTGDGFDDLFLLGSPISWLCIGPRFYCVAHNTMNWQANYDPVPGDFNGDGYDDLLLIGAPTSWLCSGSGLGCSLNNNHSWRLFFQGSSARLDADGNEDLFLVGSPRSWSCYGPNFHCVLDNENSWADDFDVAVGDFDGNGLSSAFLTGDPHSHICEVPSAPCQESALQPIVCESDVSSLVQMTVTHAMDTAITYATFQSHSQRVVQNPHGIFLAANAEPDHWVLRRSLDGGTTFTTATEGFELTNPPALETDATGNVYAFYAQDLGQDNAIFQKFEASSGFTNPSHTTVIPVQDVSKYTTYFDEIREQIYFMNFNEAGPNFFTLSPADGSICNDAFCPQKLTAAGAEARLQYPHLQMDGNTLYAAWSTTPNTHQSGALIRFRGIHAMASDDGGRAWRNIEGTPLTTPVIADDTGPTRQIVEACDLETTTWLSNFAPVGGDLHFLYLSRRGDQLQHYVSIEQSTGMEMQRTAPLNGSKVSIQSLDGFFVVDGSVLYMVAEGCDRIVVMVSHDNGASWQDYAASALIPPGHGIYGVSGFREVTTDGFIVGAYTEFAEAADSSDHRVMFFKVPTL